MRTRSISALLATFVLAGASSLAIAQEQGYQSFEPSGKADMQWRTADGNSFGHLVAGEWSHSEVVHLSNEGTESFPLTSIVSTNTDRLEVLLHNCPTIVEPTAGCDIVVKAKLEGAASGQASLLAFGGTDNMETSFLTVPLQVAAAK